MNQSVKLAQELPGSFGWPFLGEAIELFAAQEVYYWHRFQLYRAAFKTQIMGMKIACLVGPDANQLVLQDQADKFSSRVGWSFLEPLLGEGILLQDGCQHQVVRQLMASAFHPQALASYFNIVQNTVENFFESWSQRNPILLIDEFRQLTLLIACRLLLGTEADREIPELSQNFSELIAGIRTVLRLDIPKTKFGRARLARRRLETFFRSMIVQRREKGAKNEFQDVLELLVRSTDEQGHSLSDSEVVTQTLQLLFGGHENISQLLCWSLFELSAHPEWIDKLLQEQTRVVGGHSLAFSHLKQLTQMSYVLKEVERLYPPLYTIPRGVIEDVEYAGYRIPKGWYVVLSPLLTHRLSELYSEPHCFDPERMAPTRSEDKKHPFALLGFGGGSHKCIGYELAQMKMKIILSTLLRRYNNWSITPARSAVTPVCPTAKVERMMQLYLS